jgi:hypothetical protein
MSEPNISGLLRAAQAARMRIRSDTKKIDEIERQIKADIAQGASTGDLILDIVLEYGLPHSTEFLEQNLRKLDAKLRTCANQFIILEVIEIERNSPTRSPIHRTVCGILPPPDSKNNPTMKRLNESEIQSGIEVITQVPHQITLSRDVITQFERGDMPPFKGMLDHIYALSFRITIGTEDVEQFILRTHSLTLTESPEARATRMKIIAKELNDLMVAQGVSIDGYPALQHFIREAAYP